MINSVKGDMISYHFSILSLLAEATSIRSIGYFRIPHSPDRAEEYPFGIHQAYIRQ